MIKEIGTNSNIKTYLTRIELIVKEIIPKNKDDYYYWKISKIKRRIRRRNKYIWIDRRKWKNIFSYG